mmetsp:Transcript_2027/g.5554  ORF Transcript_2027/g.5554 Transcript_2027/m.5554 type:complete len:242 (-) Transcript_2027:873-1598(-)
MRSLKLRAMLRTDGCHTGTSRPWGLPIMSDSRRLGRRRIMLDGVPLREPPGGASRSMRGSKGLRAPTRNTRTPNRPGSGNSPLFLGCMMPFHEPMMRQKSPSLPRTSIAASPADREGLSTPTLAGGRHSGPSRWDVASEVQLSIAWICTVAPKSFPRCIWITFALRTVFVLMVWSSRRSQSLSGTSAGPPCHRASGHTLPDEHSREGRPGTCLARTLSYTSACGLSSWGWLGPTSIWRRRP